MSCQVKVTEGVLQGKECTTFYGKKYYSFEGIPYAKPPVGRLRFRGPQEPEKWAGVRDATKPGNKCSQLNPYSNTPLEGSEDCLYLNVYTPVLPDEKIQKLPVFFFVHGGRLIFGYGDYYKPDYLIKHDVILVTINYRLNILGFLCLDIPEVPGNAGLKDTVMALRWVNKNIVYFNGDPSNVTVMGESAGGAIVTSYLTSKMADGLYHKVIAQSGVSISDLYMTDEDPLIKAKTIAANLGKDLTNPNCLYELFLNTSVEDLLIAFSAVEMSRPPSVIRAYLTPVVEKTFEGVENFFEENPRVDIPLNRFNKVPIIIGYMSHEGASFLQRDSDGNINFENDFYFFVPTLMNVKRGDRRIEIFEKKLTKFYFDDKEINNKTIPEYIDMVTDRYFTFDIMNNIHIVSNTTEIYAYKFQYSGNMNTRVMKSLGMKGTSHGDMMQYQFYRKGKHDRATKEDIRIVEMISEAYCNFARNGAPSWSDGNLKWLPYTPAEQQVLVIDDITQLMKNPNRHRLQFWRNLTGETSKL